MNVCASDDIEELLEVMHSAMVRKAIIGLAEELGREVVLKALRKLAMEGPLMDREDTSERFCDICRLSGPGEFRERMAREFGNDVIMFGKLAGDAGARDYIDFLMFCMDKADWYVTDEIGDEYSDLSDMMWEVYEGKRGPYEVFDLGVPMPHRERTW